MTRTSAAHDAPASADETLGTDVETMNTGTPVVVATDDSPASLRAVAWAARYATAHGLRLHLLHVNTWPTGMSLPLEAGAGDDSAGPAAGEGILDQARRAATGAAPDVRVTTEVAAGIPADVLVQRSHEAALVAAGHRGDVPIFGDTSLGAVASQLVMYGHCSVAVLPESMHQPGPDGPGVVVGVDTGECGQAALAWAFEAASRQHVPLTAVRAWTLASRGAPIHPAFRDAAELESEQRRLLSECLAGWRSRYPEVEVRAQVVRDHAGRALTHLSRDAALLVTGARGSGGWPGLMIGGVADAVVRHAHCPVVVAR